jgi:aspartate aminotransferase
MEPPALPVSPAIAAAIQACGPFFEFFTTSPWLDRVGEPTVCDFVAGNPQEMALPGFVAAIREAAVPKSADWFAYGEAEPSAVATVAESLRTRTGMPFGTQHVTLTSGAFAGLSLILRTVAGPGDEVVYLSPPWFFYAGMIAFAGATPVRVALSPPRFDLDVDAVAAAITPNTRAVIVNSPHNPTGRIHPPEALERLGAALSEASERIGRAIFMISDESYKRILFDGRAFTTPTSAYPNSFVVYTYGKTLLTPGERIGYVAVHPQMPEAERMRETLFAAQVVGGYQFPNRTLQHALGNLDLLSIDVEHLQRKRDRMVAGLREVGYELDVPEGTFYLLPKAPIEDDRAFAAMLAEHDVFVLPGFTMELPGWFRISLTASDEMIDRAMPGFAAAFKEATA